MALSPARKVLFIGQPSKLLRSALPALELVAVWVTTELLYYEAVGGTVLLELRHGSIVAAELCFHVLEELRRRDRDGGRIRVGPNGGRIRVVW